MIKIHNAYEISLISDEKEIKLGMLLKDDVEALIPQLLQIIHIARPGAVLYTPEEFDSETIKKANEIIATRNKKAISEAYTAPKEARKEPEKDLDPVKEELDPLEQEAEEEPEKVESKKEPAKDPAKKEEPKRTPKHESGLNEVQAEAVKDAIVRCVTSEQRIEKIRQRLKVGQDTARVYLGMFKTWMRKKGISETMLMSEVK